MVRAGKHGEYEQRFLQTNRIYVCWTGLKHDLSKLAEKPDLRELLARVYPESPKKRVSHSTGQIWPFVREMKPGDWVVTPSKIKPSVNIAEITGGYGFDPEAQESAYHHRPVKWIARDIPRSVIDQDLLYSLGAFMTICRIERNDAEKRFRKMSAAGWKATATSPLMIETSEGLETEGGVDLEQLARDQIAKMIIQKLQGHGLVTLVRAVLDAQGYTTYMSREGPDKGIDILAAPGPLGFGRPRICVQVKSSDAPVDSPTLNQLIGSMQNCHAEQGLLVSWSGFKASVDKEIPAQFFRVRLWDQDALIGEVLAHYDRLNEDLRAEFPLKRIWTVAAQDDEVAE